jgi:hypothetical protein
MNVKLSTLVKSAALLVALTSFAIPSLASASIFGDAIHAVKSVGKAVTHPAKLVKDASHVVSSAAKDVTHPSRLISDVKQIKVGKIVKRIGDDVSDVYRAAAKVSANIPVAKDFRPLMRDFARATRSVEGRWAGAAGAGLAVATGGASYAATQAGGWAYAAYLGHKGVNAAKAQVKSIKLQ